MTYAREILGDLVVATTELVETGAPPDEPWLWLVVASGIAVRAAPGDGADLIAAFERLVWSTRLAAALDDACRRTATGWLGRCLYRSACELLRELFPARDLDTSSLEIAMITAGQAEQYRPVTPPEDIPEHHWWWRAPVPPGRLRFNRRMGDLVALDDRQVSAEFRRYIAPGFVERDGCIYLRALGDAEPPDIDPTYRECQANAAALERFLPRDDSRRPVDYASIVIACARWLAQELRRAGVAYNCRIVAHVPHRAAATTIRFHRWRGVRWGVDARADEIEDAVLTLDTRDV